MASQSAPRRPPSCLLLTATNVGPQLEELQFGVLSAVTVVEQGGKLFGGQREITYAPC